MAVAVERCGEGGGGEGGDSTLGEGKRGRRRCGRTFFQPLPPLMAKPASSPSNSAFSMASAPTKYDMASPPVGRKGCFVDFVGLKSTLWWP